MNKREFKYLRAQTIRRHQNVRPEMSIGVNGIEVRGGIKCDECGLSFPKDQMLKCTNDQDVSWLCGECNDGTWYCQSCGTFCAGIPSFEFGRYAGLCDNCADQIESENSWDDEEEFDQWESEGWD